MSYKKKERQEFFEMMLDWEKHVIIACIVFKGKEEFFNIDEISSALELFSTLPRSEQSVIISQLIDACKDGEVIDSNILEPALIGFRYFQCGKTSQNKKIAAAISFYADFFEK